MMLNQGILLMVTGMGTVFLFLILMVLVMQAIGKYFKLNETRFREAVPTAPERKPADNDETEWVAAAMVAIHAHLRK